MRPTEEKPSDANLPDNYVEHMLKTVNPLPPVTIHNWWKEVNYLTTIVLTVVPLLSIYGMFTTALVEKTAVWSIIYYFFTGLGITAGYHRLWAHRSYNASKPLQYILALAGVGAVQGSIKWWSRGHRAHHRYTDTELDPYNAHKGFFYSHIGWMLFKPRRKPGVADVSDLSRNEVVRWQHRNYVPLIVTMGFILPTAVAGFGWGDWRGGFFYAGATRLLFVHHVRLSFLSSALISDYELYP
jgi:stearoyl-CoA desaturase (Delta-9 desaturase)